jgi:G3E family GTPase
MSTERQSVLQDAKSTLLKDLIKNSPKKYTAVIISDSGDEIEKKAILVPQKQQQQFGTPRNNTPSAVCPKCSKVFSESSELSEEEEKPRKRRPRHGRKHRGKKQSPIVIVSPTKLSAREAKSVAKQAQIEATIQRNAEKVARRQEKEKRRMEEEALAKARAQLEMERKERVKKILDEAKRKQQEKKKKYVTVYYTPDESESDSEYLSFSSYEEEEEEEESFDEIHEELCKLQGIASKIERAGKKIKTMVNKSLSPQKLSPKKRLH